MPLKFQARVCDWARTCFGVERATDQQERAFRFIEEALELVQNQKLTKDEVLRIVDYVFSRPPGEVRQEIGGVMVTLAALCGPLGVGMEAAGETELSRILTKVEEIREKNLRKPRFEEAQA